MRGAHDIDLQLAPEDFSIAPLHARRHRLADPGEGLVAVKPAQFYDFAVQLEAVVGEFGVAEADAARIFIKNCIVPPYQPKDNGVKLGMQKVPQFKPAEIR